MALANVPGLGAYIEQTQRNRQQPVAELEQAGSLMKIRQAMQAQEQQQAYRTELAQAKTPEEQAKVAAKYGSPSDVLTHHGRLATVENTKQMAMSRLAQQIQRDATDLAHKSRTARTSEERLHWDQQLDVLKAHAARQSAEIQAGRYTYETGNAAAPFMGAVPQAPVMAGAVAPGAAPSAAPAGGGAGGGAAPIQSAPPQIPQPALGTETGGLKPDGRINYGHMGDSEKLALLKTQLGSLQKGDHGAGGLAEQQLRDEIMRLEGAAAAPADIAPPPQSAPPAVANPAQAVPKMPPEIAAAPRKIQQQWLLQQTRPSIAGGGEFSPEALRLTAEQYLTGDRQAIQGYARNAPARIALQNEIAKLAKEKGWTGADIAAQMADFAGIMAGSRTVGNRAAQIALASSEAEKMIVIVKEQSKGFDATNFVPWNRALKAFETNTGAPGIKAYGASINSLVNVYARAISPSGVPTVSDKEHAREMLATIDSPAQVDAVLGVLRQEMKAARESPGEVRADLRKAIVGTREAKAEPQAAPTGGPKAGDKSKSKSGRPMTFDGKQWVYD